MSDYTDRDARVDLALAYPLAPQCEECDAAAERLLAYITRLEQKTEAYKHIYGLKVIEVALWRDRAQYVAGTTDPAFWDKLGLTEYGSGRSRPAWQEEYESVRRELLASEQMRKETLRDATTVMMAMLPPDEEDEG